MKGIFYTSIYYPGYISLETNRWYVFKVHEKTVGVILDAHIPTVKLIDFNNDITTIKQGEKIYIDSDLSDSKVIDYTKGNLKIKKRFCVDEKKEKMAYSDFYTRLIIAHEAVKQGQKVGSEAFFEPVLEFFISHYRVETKDIFVRLLGDLSDRYSITTCFLSYDASDFGLSIEEKVKKPRKLKFVLKRTQFDDNTESIPRLSTYEAIELSDRFSKVLNDENIYFEQNNLLVKAFEEIRINKNFKYAFLEIFIVIEVLVSRFLRNLKLQNGVSKGKLDKYETEISISYMLNVEIPAFIADITEKERNLIGQIDSIRKKRNDIVHKGDTVNETDAIEAIKFTMKLMEFIKIKGLK